MREVFTFAWSAERTIAALTGCRSKRDGQVLKECGSPIAFEAGMLDEQVGRVYVVGNERLCETEEGRQDGCCRVSAWIPRELILQRQARARLSFLAFPDLPLSCTRAETSREQVEA